jgi:hypothetical protein
VTFIAEQKDRFGVEPICAVLTEFGYQIAPSTYYAALTRPRSERAVRDEELMQMIDKSIGTTLRCTGPGRCGGNCAGTVSM